MMDDSELSLVTCYTYKEWQLASAKTRWFPIESELAGPFSERHLFLIADENIDNQIS